MTVKPKARRRQLQVALLEMKQRTIGGHDESMKRKYNNRTRYFNFSKCCRMIDAAAVRRHGTSYLLWKFGTQPALPQFGSVKSDRNRVRLPLQLT
jgi:hypothetical protein